MFNKRTNYRKIKRFSTNRKYNRNLYGISKKANKLARDKFAADPFKKLNECGIVGKICNKVGNKVVTPIISTASYSSVGHYYNHKKDSPYKGSFLYTFFYFVYSIIMFAIVSLVISLLF